MTASKNGLLHGRKNNVKEADDNIKLGTEMENRMRKIKEIWRKSGKERRKE